MPLQNRVAPDGRIVATPERGTMMGNRGGCFHTDDGRLKRRHWASIHWICCVLSFKNRRRRVRQPGLYTELFFLDEATALAAGHRPCFECRRADATRFQRLWADVHGLEVPLKVQAMDRVLQAERLDTVGSKRTTTARLDSLPDGTIVQDDRIGPALVLGGHLRPWRFTGYGPPVGSKASVAVFTPPSIVAILRSGYRPSLHPSAVPGTSTP